MKITKEHIIQIVNDEMNGGHCINEELSFKDIDMIRDLIRREISLVFFELFKKRSVWI